MKEYVLEIWLDGNCIHEENINCESEDEAWSELEWIADDYFISGNYSEQGYEIGDFELVAKEV